MKRLAVIAVLVVAACTPPAPAPAPALAPAPLAPTTVTASFGKTWNAVVDLLSERNIPVKTMDRSSGFVAAEVSSVSNDELRKLSRGCTGFLAAMANGGDPPTGIARYNILVRGDSTSSTVKVTARFTGPQGDCATQNTFEAPFQREVKARAEAK